MTKAKRRELLRDYFKSNPDAAARVAGSVFGSYLDAHYPTIDLSTTKLVLPDGREIPLDSEEGIEETAKLLSIIPGGEAFVEGARSAMIGRRLAELGEEQAREQAAKKGSKK